MEEIKDKKPNKRKKIILAIAVLIGISIVVTAITVEIYKNLEIRKAHEERYTEEEIQAYRDSFNEFFYNTNMIGTFYHLGFENKAKDMNVTWENLYPDHEENRYYIERSIDYLDEMDAVDLEDNEIFLRKAYRDYKYTQKADLKCTLVEIEDLLKYTQETNSTIYIDAFYITITIPQSSGGKFMKVLYHCDNLCSMAYGYEGDTHPDVNATDTNAT